MSHPGCVTVRCVDCGRLYSYRASQYHTSTSENFIRMSHKVYSHRARTGVHHKGHNGQRSTQYYMYYYLCAAHNAVRTHAILQSAIVATPHAHSAQPCADTWLTSKHAGSPSCRSSDRRGARIQPQNNSGSSCRYSTALPHAHARHRSRPVAGYGRRLLHAMRKMRRIRWVSKHVKSGFRLRGGV